MSQDHQTQLNAAVVAALSPGPLQAQAYDFLQNVRASSSETWQAGLGCFLAGGRSDGGEWKYTYGGETRLFGLQVVDSALGLAANDPQAFASRLQTVRDEMVNYLNREYVEGSGEGNLGYLRNKVVQTFFILFMHTYETSWPDFFVTFKALLRKHPAGTTATTNGASHLNPRATDLFLRLLHEVSIEISDADLRLNKPHQRQERDTKLRDAVRPKDAAGIAQETFAIVAEALQGLGQSESDGRVGLVGKRATECLEMGVRVVADYVGWIDIGLIVTPTWIPFLYQALRLPHVGIRVGAADALIATVTKGMLPANRLELYEILGLGEILSSLLAERNGKGKVNEVDEDEVAFAEKLAKILNGMGIELCKVCEEAAATLETKSAALNMATQLLPLLLQFVEDNAWAVCSAVLPFASATLTRYKKDKKASPSSHLTDGKRAFLSRLLELVTLKMRYPLDDSFDWEPPAGPGEEEDEDMVAFADRRRQLRLVFDAVAWVDEDLFKESMHGLINSVFDALDAGRSSTQTIEWQQAELALWVTYIYGEAVKGSIPYSPISFVELPIDEKRKILKQRDSHINFSQYPQSTLGKLMARMISSPISAFPHPSIQLQWFECIVRYHDFFSLFPTTITAVLPAFVDERGVHQPNKTVRARCFYLFHRFLVQGRLSLQPHVTRDMVQGILERIQDLLPINADVPTPDGPGVDILYKATTTPSFFDSQLYLYEAVGQLISTLGQDPDHQISLLQAVLAPLLSGIQQNLRTEVSSLDDVVCILNIHHYILAIGSLAKGFPDVGPREANPAGKWSTLFKEATDAILRVTKLLSGFQAIRDAARSSFNKIVATLGTDALPHVPILIDCLISQLTMVELVEFLGFVGQLTHKYKAQFAPLLDDLLIPLFTRVFAFLDQTIAGTDDIVVHSELRRAYFTLLGSIINAGMSDVFLSEKNKPHLQMILNSIAHYTGAVEALPNDQRTGFGVFNRLIPVWVNTVNPSAKGKDGGIVNSPLPGFEQFIYEKAIPLCFSIPSRRKFDWGDAQSFQVLQEISTMIKALVTLRGNESVQFIAGTFLPSIGCPSESAQALMQAFADNADGRQSRKPLVDFFAHARQTWCPQTE